MTAAASTSTCPGSRSRPAGSPKRIWCSFVPIVAEPERWLLDKLGQDVSPLDVVSRGTAAARCRPRCAIRRTDGAARRSSPPTPPYRPGTAALLEFTDELPDLSGGLHVLLHDNVWGTNFPMWNEGDARFRFHLAVGPDGPS